MNKQDVVSMINSIIEGTCGKLDDEDKFSTHSLMKELNNSDKEDIASILKGDNLEASHAILLSLLYQYINERYDD